MANRALVSAIMPVYNEAAFVRAAIDSVLAQTFTDWELIIVDDGSTDETPRLLAHYTDPRIHVCRLPTNRGRGVARNHAVSRASGTYVAVCDADDISLPDRFARQVAFAEAHAEVDVVSSQVKYFWADETPRDYILYPEDQQTIQHRFAKGKMAVCHAAALIRRSCFERYGLYCEECRRAQDLEFFLRIRENCTFATLPESLVLYRQRIGRASMSGWLELETYRRYAVYRSRAIVARPNREPLTFDQFRARWSSRLSARSLDLLRYLYVEFRALRGKPRVLK